MSPRHIVLVLGGTRSGKSAEAEAIITRLAASRPVTYVATAILGDDPDLARRIEHHRRRRPADWRTVDAGTDLAARIRRIDGPILLDAIGPWVAANLNDDGTIDSGALLAAIADHDDALVVVSEEVGLAVHPPTVLGRRFVDAVGELNQRIADLADEVRLVIAGRVLDLPRSREDR